MVVPLIAVSPPPLLPCPAEAGWDLVARGRLPRRDANGQPSGGFSAASYRSDTDALLLLSDAPGADWAPGAVCASWGACRSSPCSSST